MTSQRGPAWDDVKGVLRSLAMSYIGDSRAGGELRTSLIAIEKERAQVLGAMPEREREFGSASDRRLAEIERVRRTIARSSAASSERLRALEAVIAAVAGDVMQLAPDARVADVQPPAAPNSPQPDPAPQTSAPARPEARPETRPETRPERHPQTRPETQPDAQPASVPGPADSRGEAWVRGGWSPPTPEDDGDDDGRLR